MTKAATPTKGYYPVSVVAAMCDLDARRIQQLAKEGVIPKARRGEYHLVDCVRGYVRYLRDRQPAPAAAPETFDASRARKMEADAALAELDLAVRRSKLVPAEKYERELGRAFARVRSRLLPLPSRAAPDLMALTDELKIEAILDRYVLEVIEELRTETVPDDEGDDVQEAA